MSPRRAVVSVALACLAFSTSCGEQRLLEPEAAEADRELVASRQEAGAARLVPDEYIVLFDRGAADVSGLARRLAAQQGLELRHTYEHAVKGFAARIPPQALDGIRRNPNVRLVEPVMIYRLEGTAAEAPPNAPSDLVAVLGPEGVDLAWTDNSTEEKAFEVWRSTAGPAGSFSQLSRTRADQSSYLDADVSTAGDYCYRVRAVAGKDVSGFSNTACVTVGGGAEPPPPSGLAAPSDLTATPVTDTRIDLSWTDSSTGERAFEVFRSTTGPEGAYAKISREKADVVAYSDSDVTPGQETCYKVQAVDGGQRSDFSNVACATTGSPPPPSPPAAPTDLSATTVDYRRIDLSWTDASSDETGFRIERREQSAATWSSIAEPAADVTSWADAGLSPETGYCYRILATNGNGDSEWSAEACATTDPAPTLPPAPPVPTDGLRVRLLASDLGVTLSDGAGVSAWPNRGGDGDALQSDAARLPTYHAGGGLFGGFPYVGFNEGTDDDEALEVAGVADHGSSTLIAVVRQEDVGAHNYGLFGTWSSSADRTGFVTYRRDLEHRISYWDPVNDWRDASFTVAAGEEHIIVWRVAGGSSIDFQVDGTDAGTNPIPAAMHTPFDRYVIGMTEPITDSRFDGQVAELLFYDRAIDNCERNQIVADLGARYGIPVGTTGSCSPPAAPTDLSATTVDYRRIDLSWTDASSDETGFRIERREQSAATWSSIAEPAADVTSWADAGLSPETGYCYRILATNGNGDSEWSAEACATTDPAPPGACLDTGNHDDLADLWNIAKIGADRNVSWQATQQPGCEIEAWYFGLDSGVDSDHPDLNVVEVRNFVAAEPGNDGEDRNGHGTHTAGTAAAMDGNGGVVGVAPGAAVHSFRICDDGGSCTTGDIIAAIDEVLARKLATPGQPMVANMSLGGDVSEAMDEALRRSANGGVIYAVAAGNGLIGACLIPANSQNVSPARVGDDAINASDGSDGDTRRVNGVIATTSSTAADADANCNYGNPVTVAAPGVGVKSTWLNGGYNTISGTSMATPHVAGAALLYLQEHPGATPSEVEAAIVERLAPWTTDDLPNASGRLDVSALY